MVSCMGNDLDLDFKGYVISCSPSIFDWGNMIYFQHYYFCMLLRRVWHADGGCLLLRTPGPVSLGLAYVLLVETNPFPNLSLFYRTMLFEYPSVLSRFCFEVFSNMNLLSISIQLILKIVFSRTKSYENDHIIPLPQISAIWIIQDFIPWKLR